MKSGKLALGVVVTVILLTAAGSLYVMAGASGERHCRTALTLMREIQQLSYNWSIEAHRVKSDPHADLDSLAAFVPRMTHLKESLTTATRHIPDPPDSLARDINSYVSAINAKEEGIGRFTAGYAVVRDSMRYFPLAASNLVQQAEDMGEDNLVRIVTSLANSMDSYLITLSDVVKRRLTGELRDLRRASATYPLPLANTLADLISHGEILLTWKEPVETLFQEAASDNVSELTNRLVGNLELDLSKREAKAAYYERGTLSVIGVLALFWILFAVQYRIRGSSNPTHATHEVPAAHSEAGSPGARLVIENEISATEESSRATPAAAEEELLAIEDEPLDGEDEPSATEDESSRVASAAPEDELVIGDALLIIENKPLDSEAEPPAMEEESPRVAPGDTEDDLLIIEDESVDGEGDPLATENESPRLPRSSQARGTHMQGNRI